MTSPPAQKAREVCRPRSSQTMSVSWNDEDEAAIPPRGSLMQLELAECVETKTVTTTTTTKRSYPPLYFHELRSLCSLDAKEYPLAMKPTPPELSRFTIDLDEFYHNDPWASLGGIPRDSSVESQSSQPQPSHQRHGRGAKTIFLPGRGQESIPSHDLAPANNNTFSRRAAARAASLSASPSASASRKALRSAAAVATTADIPLAVSDRLRRAVSGPGKKDGNGKELLAEKPQTRATPTKYLATPDNSLVAAPSSHPVRGTRLRPFRPDRTTETQEAGSSSGAGSGTGSGTGSGSGSGPSSGQTSFLYDAASPTGSDSHTIFGNSVATPPILGADAEPFADTEETLQDTTRALPPRVLGTVGMLDASLPSPRLSPTLSATANPLSASADEDPDELEDSPLSRLLTRQDHAWAQSQSAADDGRGNGSLLVLSSDEQQDLAQHDDYKDRGSGGKRHDSGADSGLMATTISRSTFVETRSLLERFDALPNEMQTFMMYQFLRRCTRKTLHMVADVVNPALKCDFLKRLPLELSFHILSYLEYRDLCRAAQVSKHWRNITDCNETGWKELFDRDGYQLSMGELQKAISQGWGWQDPVGPEGCEIDLSVRNRMASSESELLRSSAAAASSRTDQPSSVRVRTSKRKRGIAAYPSTDRAKRRVSGAAQEPHKDEFSSSSFSSSTSSPLPFSSSATAAAVSSYSSSSSLWPRLYKADGPIAAANAAAVAVPEPEIGIPSIRKLHLFKSLYRRHHMIRKSWTSGKVKPSHVAFTAHPRHVITCLQFDDEKIITGSDDTLIHVYDTKTGKLLKKLEGHEGGVWALQYEGNVLVSGSTDRSVRVWDIEKGRCTQVFYGHTSTVRCLQILMPSKTGRYVDGKPEMMPPNPLVITGSRDNQLRVWRLPQAGSPRYIQTGPPANDSECPYFMRILSGHTNSVRSIAAHGDVLVSGSYDSTVRVWRISTGEALHVLEGHSQRVYSVVLDTKRNRCISGSMDSFVKIWDLDTGACLHTLEGHALLVGLLDLREEKLVSAAADSTLRVWDPQTGRCKSTLTAHTGAITCFQHDGRKVISGSEKTVKMWDIQTGECIQDLLTDLTGVWQVKFDERRCVAAVQRDNLTYVEILDFGAVRDGKPPEELGKRILLNAPEVQALIEEEA